MTRCGARPHALRATDEPGAFLSKLLHVQIVRAFAALSVAALHAQHDAAAMAAKLGLSFEPLEALPWAAGVDAFFVVSGFIMVHASRKLFGMPGGRAVFLSRRIARIVPLYWAVTTVYLALGLIAPGLLNSEILAPWPVIASYLFIPFERPDGAVQPLYSLGWTLNYEMFFYGLFALTIVWPRRKAVALLAALLVGLVVVGRLVALPQPLGFWTGPIMLEFAFGLGLGLMHAQGVRLSRLACAALVAAGLAALALNLMRPEGFIVLPRVLAWGVPAALIVGGAALGHERPVSRWRLARFGVAVGDASYALYLVHPFAIRAGSEIAVRTGIGAVVGHSVGPWGLVALSLCAATLAALAVHIWFERPATERMRRLIEPVRSPQFSSP